MQPVFFYAAVALAIILVLRIMTLPLRLFFKLLLNTLCGYALLLLFDLCSGLTGFTVPINIVSAAIVGLLGLPGFGFLLILRYAALP